MLKSRYQQGMDDFNLGTLSQKDWRVEQQQIGKRILDFLEKDK